MELDSDEEKQFSIFNKPNDIGDELPQQFFEENSMFYQDKNLQLEKLFSNKGKLEDFSKNEVLKFESKLRIFYKQITTEMSHIKHHDQKIQSLDKKMVT